MLLLGCHLQNEKCAPLRVASLECYAEDHDYFRNSIPLHMTVAWSTRNDYGQICYWLLFYSILALAFVTELRCKVSHNNQSAIKKPGEQENEMECSFACNLRHWLSNALLNKNALFVSTKVQRRNARQRRWKTSTKNDKGSEISPFAVKYFMCETPRSLQCWPHFWFDFRRFFVVHLLICYSGNVKLHVHSFVAL